MAYQPQGFTVAQKLQLQQRRKFQRLTPVRQTTLKTSWYKLALTFGLVVCLFTVNLKSETKIKTTPEPQVASPVPAALAYVQKPGEIIPVATTSALSIHVKTFLEAQKSPLAGETDYLLTKQHWKLLIAISAIESQYCKRQLNHNCWGLNSPTGYLKFASWRDAIDATDQLITKWQKRGKWLTIAAMNCSYVVPCSSNWVNVVTKTMNTLNQIETKSP